MRKAKILKRKVLFDKFGKKLVEEKLKVSDGSKLDWYYLDTPRSILIVPLTPENKIVLVKLYRYNLKGYVYEIPAGSFETKKGKILEEAKRELREETGYVSEKFVDLGRYYTLPSETNRWIHLVLALKATKKEEPKLDNVIERHFDMSIELFDFKEVVKRIGKANSIIKGVEHGFAILLADKYLRASR